MCNQNEFSTKEYLTDGGVYDNLGLEKLLASRGNAKDLDLIIVSDAEGSFDWAVDRPYTSVVSRNVRASDMLMSRMSLLRYEKLGTQLDAIWRVHIGDVLLDDDDPSVPDPGTQRSFRNIRTDLDSFSGQEVRALVGHGYATTRRMLLTKNLDKQAPLYSWPALAELASPTVKQWTTKEAERSQSRKARLLSGRDWATWVTAFLLLIYFGVAAAPFYVQREQVTSLQRANRLLVNQAQSYVRQTNSNSVIIFVHGVLTDPIEAWTCPSTHTYWPELICQDPAFNGFDVYTVGYDSRTSTLSELAGNLYLRLDSDGVIRKYKHLVFVCHGLGGLIIESMLLDRKR